ncbi:MAG: hypothetical protein TV42_05965 [Wolbachia endosymbiont of Dactylopius coccus]|nr:MAG: hypothetical protein TV42_05965 [Wolbachia endosymbiont of Dactylopius coccus]
MTLQRHAKFIYLLIYFSQKSTYLFEKSSRKLTDYGKKTGILGQIIRQKGCTYRWLKQATVAGFMLW